MRRPGRFNILKQDLVGPVYSRAKKKVTTNCFVIISSYYYIIIISFAQGINKETAISAIS